jgi:hypothetical protein
MCLLRWQGHAVPLSDVAGRASQQQQPPGAAVVCVASFPLLGRARTQGDRTVSSA